MLYIYINAGLVCTGRESSHTSCLLAQKAKQTNLHGAREVA